MPSLTRRTEKPDYSVKIYADQWKIISTIKEIMPDTNFNHEYKGTAADNIVFLGATFSI